MKSRNIIAFFYLLVMTPIYSQIDSDSIANGQQVEVKMINGDEYRGQLINKESDLVIIRNENGELRLIATNVKSMKSNNYKGKFAFKNPHDTRYFFGPSGIPIQKGHGYYQNLEVVGNFVNYGITKNISIGGGLEFISTVLGNPIYFLSPKAGFKISKNMHVGAGIFFAGLGTEANASIGYGAFTYGSSETNVTLGLGYGFVDGEVKKSPAIMLSGTHRINKTICLLSENYILGNSYGIDSNFLGIQGIRILARKNSFDFGAIIIPEISNELPALPYVGYARTF